jgi:hypothetical protein
VVQQTLLDIVLGLGSIVLTTDAVLVSRAAKRSRLGQVVLRGLPAGRADQLVGVIRLAMLLERRRMVQNFMATR